jgi:hypothetical protein
MMQCGSIKDMGRSLTAALMQTEKTFHDSCHFLLRTANLPLLQARVTRYIATGLVHELPLKSLGEKIFQGFSIIMMLADSKETKEAKRTAAGRILAEDAVGESNEKKTKIDTSFIPVENVSKIADLLTLLSNEIARQALLLKMTPEIVTQDSSWLHSAMDRVAKAVTDRSRCKLWKATHEGTIKETKLIMLGINRVVDIAAELFSSFDHTKLKMAAEDPALWSIMPTEPFETAEAELKDLLLELKRVFTGVNSAVPDCTIYENSDAKSRFDRAAHLKLKASMYSKSPWDDLITDAKRTYDDLINNGGGGGSKADKKKQKTKTSHSDPANLGADKKDGYFIISQQGTASYKLPLCLDCKILGESFSIWCAFYMLLRHHLQALPQASQGPSSPAEAGHLGLCQEQRSWHHMERPLRRRSYHDGGWSEHS